MKAIISPFGRSSGAFGPLPFDGINHKVDALANGGVFGGDVFILWGGRDISPRFYGQKPHPKNQAGNDVHLTERDRLEWYLCHEARKNLMPIIGVCRGAQLLCAFAGGSLFQDVTDHNTAHKITTHTGETFVAAADHHQMMDLRGTKYRMLAWADEKRSSFYDTDEPDGGTNLPVEGKEPEVVYFPEINALAIQPHPEWERENTPFLLWLNNVVLPAFFKGEL